MNRIQKGSAVILTIGLIIGFSSLALAEADFEIHPINAGVYTTMGIIQANGDTTASYGSTGESIDTQPYSRFGAWVSASGTIEERTDFSLALGINTSNSLPLTSGSPFTRMQSQGAWLGHAFVSHKLGDFDEPFLTLKLGAFPYGYSSSKNLGGHLLTGGTYPGHLTSGWGNLTYGNAYTAQGLLAHFSLMENALNVDVGAFFEHWLAPHYDISPTIIASYNILDLVEIGAGAVFSHLIAWDGDAVTPEYRENAYYNDKRLPEKEWLKPGLDATDTLIVPATDPRLGQSVDPASRPDLVKRQIDPTYLTAEQNGVPNSALDYYTFKGIKAMGRIAITPFSLGEDLAKVSLYGEATLLGVKDYPFFYEEKSERMPILFGVNVPLPGGFDVTAEAEYYKNKFMNHIYDTYVDVIPRWREGEGDFFLDSLDQEGKRIKEDNIYLSSNTPKKSHENGEWMWSISANKTVYDRITFRFKMARDYLRMYNFFGNPSDEPAFQNPGGWYLVLKTEVSI